MRNFVFFSIFLLLLIYPDRADSQHSDRKEWIDEFDQKILSDLKKLDVDTVLIYMVDSFVTTSQNFSIATFKRHSFRLVSWRKNGEYLFGLFVDTNETSNAKSAPKYLIEYFFKNKLSDIELEEKFKYCYKSTQNVWIDPSENYYCATVYFSGKYYHLRLSKSEIYSHRGRFKRVFKREIKWFKLLESAMKLWLQPTGVL